MSLGSTSVMAPRATPTASAQTWSSRAARVVVLVVTGPLFPTATRSPQRLPQIVAHPAGDAGRRDQSGWCDAAASHARTHRRHRRRAARLLVRGSVRGGAWVTRRVGDVRARGAANEIGMVRLFDLHALSCAGDTLIAIGLAGTIFFNVPLGEARSKVALYLLDHDGAVRAAGPGGRPAARPLPARPPVRPGRHHAGPGLPGLRRSPTTCSASASIRPRSACWRCPGRTAWPAPPPCPGCCPRAIGLSQVGARASVYGTFAGALVAPIGLAAFWFGPQWPLRVAVGHLPGRHGHRAAAAAAGRLRPAGGGAAPVPHHAAPAPRHRPPAVRPAGGRHADRQRQLPLPVRLPAALLRLRDQGRTTWTPPSSAGTSAARARWR